MRRITAIILAAYAGLTVYVLLRSILGLSFQVLPALLLSALAFGFSLLHAVQRLGWRRALLFLGLTFAISLLYESIGVATGWIYGAYHYNTNLGPLFLNLVPYLIPVTWFMMLYPSYVMSERAVRSQKNGWKRWLGVAAVGGAIMTAWDLAMDPVMVSRGHWVWEVKGAYFGVPIQNYLGWWLTSFTILAIFGWLSRRYHMTRSHPGSRFDRLAVVSYAITASSSVISALASGLSGPALAGFFAMFPWVLASWKRD